MTDRPSQLGSRDGVTPGGPDRPAAGRLRADGRPKHTFGSRGLRWVAAAVLLGALIRIGIVAAAQLAYPFDLRYETPNVRSVQVIRDGLDPYSPSVYADVPFVFTQYAPLGLWLVAWLPDVPGRAFLVGRCVALVAMLLVAGLLFRADGRRTHGALAALAAGWFFLLRAPSEHVAQFRVDALALAFSVASLALLVTGRRTRGRVALAALLFALGVATKQSYVAAGGAGLVYLWLEDRRAALLYGGVAGGLLGAGALAATLGSGAGFWFCLLAATRPPFLLHVFVAQWSLMLSQPAFSALLAVSGLAALASHGARSLRASPWPAFAALSGLMLVPVSLTRGTYAMHFLEFQTALLFLCVFALGRTGIPAQLVSLAPAGLLGCALVAALELAPTLLHPGSIPVPQGPSVDHVRARFENLRMGFDERGIPHRTVLAFSEPREAALVADRIGLCPAWLYDQLWSTGDLSPEPVVDAVRRHAFDVLVIAQIVTFPPREYDESPRARILRAVESAYRPYAEDRILRYLLPAP